MAIFTKTELADYVQVDVSTISDSRYQLLLELVTTEIVNVIGQARFDATAESKFKPVALDMTKRMFTNPSGLRSEQATIDDYTRTLTYASETVVPFEATVDERRRIRKAAGLKNAFTIRIVDECSRPAC
jgi:hypothetical protein